MAIKGTDKIRNDEYYTHKKAVEPLWDFLPIGAVIWCPADIDEKSKIAESLRELGHEVICTHIDTGQDFLTYKPNFDFDYIITNPPYSIRKQFFSKALEYKKPFAFLIPLVSIALKDFRMNLNSKVSIINFEERLKYWQKDPSENIAGSSETSWFTYGFEMMNKTWYTVKRGNSYCGMRGRLMSINELENKFNKEYIEEKLNKIEDAVKEINCKEIPGVVNQIVKDNTLAIKKELQLITEEEYIDQYRKVTRVAGYEILMNDLIEKDSLNLFQYEIKKTIEERAEFEEELKLVSGILDRLFKDDYGECRPAVGLFRNKEYNFAPMFETWEYGNDTFDEEQYEYLKNKYGDYDERRKRGGRIMKEWISIILYVLLWITAISLQIIFTTLFLGITINHFINGEIYMGSFGIVILTIVHYWAFKPVVIKERRCK